MGDLGLEVRGQVDDVDGVKRTLLGTDTASDAQALRDEGDLGGRVYFDAQLARAHHGTGLFAFLPTFLGRVSARQRGRAIGGRRLPWACTVVGEGARVSNGQILCVEG